MDVAAVDTLEALHLQLHVVFARRLPVLAFLPAVAVAPVPHLLAAVEQHTAARGPARTTGPRYRPTHNRPTLQAHRPTLQAHRPTLQAHATGPQAHATGPRYRPTGQQAHATGPQAHATGPRYRPTLQAHATGPRYRPTLQAHATGLQAHATGPRYRATGPRYRPTLQAHAQQRPTLHLGASMYREALRLTKAALSD